MRKKNLTEQQLRDLERFHGLMEKEENKKLNRAFFTKDRIAWWCTFLAFVMLGWLIWDVFHIGEYLFAGWRVYFGMFKFFATIVLFTIANNLIDKKQ